LQLAERAAYFLLPSSYCFASSISF
jgi:hypothetical protein